MKITLGPISFDILLFLRVCVPTVVFIVLCTGILWPFDALLLWLDQNAPDLILEAWLTLLVFYIIMGVAFIFFSVRFLRRSFGSQELRVQRRMAILSGVPFYVACLLFFVSGIVGMVAPDLLTPDMINAVEFFNLAGFIGFALVSVCYVILSLILLGRPAATVRPEVVE